MPPNYWFSEIRKQSFCQIDFFLKVRFHPCLQLDFSQPAEKVWLSWDRNHGSDISIPGQQGLPKQTPARIRQLDRAARALHSHLETPQKLRQERTQTL
jgi:hypothetical protein